MTKDQFKNFNGTAICECCGKKYSKDELPYQNLRLDGRLLRCRVCDWIYENKEKVDNSGLTGEKLYYVVHYLLFNKNQLINDIAEYLNMSIDDTIKIYNSLRIVNKIPTRVKCKCDQCGKDIYKKVYEYQHRKDHVFCSKECAYDYKRQHPKIGFDNPTCLKQLYKCDQCGKDFLIKRNLLLKTNRFGKPYKHFCCTDCANKYQSENYKGENAIRYGAVLTDEQKQHMIEGVIKSKTFDTGIQLLVNSYLEKLNINYFREEITGYYSVDNYLTDNNLYIEVMGDYWHCNPLLYNAESKLINHIQKKNIIKDKCKHTYVKNKTGKEILYLWEYDINNNPYLCEQLILHYTNLNGVIQNYHSFNWSIDNNQLILNDNIIIPYQDMTVGAYSDLLIDK